MPLNTGTYDISALLAARFQSVADFDMNTVIRILQADLAAHNQIVQTMVAEMAEITTDRQRLYGSSIGGEMVETDEYGRAPTQRAAPGSTVGFPLRLFQFAVGWTRKYLEMATPADLAQRQLAAEQAHMRAIQRDLKRAIYGSANYTYRDHLVDNVDLAVKRFVNADSAAIPNGPNGETFDAATHTHYDANAGLNATVLTALVNDVIEHGHGAQVRIGINKADEAAVRALAGFTAYPDPRIVFRATDTPATTVDLSRLDNRPIGIFAGAEVWVKSWAIANYAVAWDAGDPRRPVSFRQRSQTTLQGLRLAADNDAYPLHAQYMEAEFGLGVWTRTNGAVLYFGGGAYVNPTIS